MAGPSVDSPSLSISTPTLPKGGGAIQSIGAGWAAVGASGATAMALSLPIAAGRGYAPSLGLAYSSHGGQSAFGQGWSLGVPAIARRTHKGVPAYTDEDDFVGPDGEVLVAERRDDGTLVRRSATTCRELVLDETFDVVRYFPRVEGAWARIESWRGPKRWFWLVHGADGSLHLYGVTARTEATGQGATRIAQWWLEESVAANGEKIRYVYVHEDAAGLTPEQALRDHTTCVYLQRVRYGNDKGSLLPDLLQSSVSTRWMFEAVLDYGERPAASVPYEPQQPWTVRSDPFSSFAFGFEVRMWRLCRHVLMVHDIAELGKPNVVAGVSRFVYDAGSVASRLVEATRWAYDAEGNQASTPRTTFRYSDMLPWNEVDFAAFEAMPGLNDGAQYQFVDLYGEGVPGVLYRTQGAWYYRAPRRAGTGDTVGYGAPGLLPALPVLASARTSGALIDLTGDGRLDWAVSAPGMSGFFTLDSDRQWRGFVPFDAFPTEFTSPVSRLADIMGDGRSDMVVIGPRSVRVYPNLGAAGFGLGLDVPYDGDDALPGGEPDHDELIAFADPLGSGQQHLVRIRHDELSVWPNLGRGRFGARLLFARLPFTHDEFDPSRIRLADIDGSGAVDLIYLRADDALVFRNEGGNGLAAPLPLHWPVGVRYDRLCEVSAVDLSGNGCASLVLTVPYMTPRHWLCDFAGATPPNLLQECDNHMGAVSSACYRSSAQEWLDEKAEREARGESIVCELPFAMQVVVEQRQKDAIAGSMLQQTLRYRHGYYDGKEREFRGFGLLLRTDADVPAADTVQEEGFTAPALVKTWFHVGREPVHLVGTDTHDPAAPLLGATLYARYDDATGEDRLDDDWNDATRDDLARALGGSPLRTEVFGLDDPGAPPYSVQASRYMVRVVRPRGTHDRYAVTQPLALESIAIDYGRMPTDPRIEHHVGLRWDGYGTAIHDVRVNYARRHGVAPFDEADEHYRRWWDDSHDDAQWSYYFAESRSQWIHLPDPQWWRLALPWRSRGDAWVVPDTELTVGDIGYESFIVPDGPLSDTQPRTLAALSRQGYQGCVDGTADFAALPDCTETAEFDELALSAYDEVLTRPELDARLEEVGYTRMKAFLPEDDRVLWSAQRGFATFSDVATFHRVTAYRLTAYLGQTTATYDPHGLYAATVTLPDGCKTVTEYDYMALQPWRTTDPNGTVREVLYDPLGRVRATSFYGKEEGKPVGFAPLSAYTTKALTPDQALADPATALGDAATAYFYAADAWETSRRPPHAVGFTADRYPGDPEKQIRTEVSDTDGFGRSLQHKQRVEPGDAFKVDDQDRLVVENGAPVTAHADVRWRVSERVEYNNKGLTVRVYRPYFASTYRYIHDEAFREVGLYDRQFYDPLGRPTVTLTAAGWMRRQTYWPWYTIAEDENDTAEEVLASREA